MIIKNIKKSSINPQTPKHFLPPPTVFPRLNFINLFPNSLLLPLMLCRADCSNSKQFLSDVLFSSPYFHRGLSQGFRVDIRFTTVSQQASGEQFELEGTIKITKSQYPYSGHLLPAQVAESPSNTYLEHFQGWGFPSFSGLPVPPPHSLPDILTDRLLKLFNIPLVHTPLKHMSQTTQIVSHLHPVQVHSIPLSM